MTGGTTRDGATADAGASTWDAIQAALASVHGDRQPRRWGTNVPYRLGGHDPLPVISAYASATPVPHWHFVTYGFSEPHGRESEAEGRGCGFELTFRLAGDVTRDPPSWPLSLLQDLARYGFEHDDVFRPGDHLPSNGPICLDEPTLITDIVFVVDPELPRIEAPTGPVDFVQVVGVTADEASAARRWRTTGLLEAMSDRLPLGVTDLGRGSFLDDPEVRRVMSEGQARDGSSSDHLMTEVLGWGQQPDRPGTTYVTVGARQMQDLLDLLPLRLPYGRFYVLSGPEAAVMFRPGDVNEVSHDGHALEVSVTDATLRDLLEQVPARRGSYELASWPGFVVHVLPTELTDRDGTVVEVIG